MNYIEKLYSDAFEDGFDYAIEKLYAEEEKEEKKRSKVPYVLAGLGGGALGTAVGTNTGSRSAAKDVWKTLYGENWKEDFKKMAASGMSKKELEKHINRKADKLLRDEKRAGELGASSLKKIGKGALLGGAVGTGLGVGSVALYRHLKDRNME